MPSVPSDRGLTVAVTGPTGGIGLALLRALDRARGIAEVRGMPAGPSIPPPLACGASSTSRATCSTAGQ